MPAQTEAAQLAEPRSCAHFTAQACCSSGLKNPTGRHKQFQMEQSLPTTGTQHNCWRGTASQTAIIIITIIIIAPSQARAVQQLLYHPESKSNSVLKDTAESATRIQCYRPELLSCLSEQQDSPPAPSLSAKCLQSLPWEQPAHVPQAGISHSSSVPGTQKRRSSNFLQQQQQWCPHSYGKQQRNTTPGFYIHFPSACLNFNFKPTPSVVLKGDSTPDTIKEQEQPEHSWHGTWAQWP